jgi:ketosteroid isomerase-like protein
MPSTLARCSLSRVRTLSVMLLGSAACASHAPAPSAGSSAPAADPIAALGWLEGRWQTGTATDGATEHWARIDAALIGVGLTAKGGRTAFFEVFDLRLDGDVPVYHAIPGGQHQARFRLTEGGQPGQTRALFSNPQHDWPQALRYERTGDTLRARASAPGGRTEEYAWQLGPAGRAAELEAADRAFAADVARRGIDAWGDWFDADGAMWNDRPVKGHESVRASMAPVFSRDDFRIVWSPVASGLSPAGDLGYTVGRGQATWKAKPGEPISPYCSIYVTIWRRQADATWRVLFDVGFPRTCAAG